MIKVNVLRKCGHLERFAMSIGVTDIQIEEQRLKQRRKFCLECLTRKFRYKIEAHKREIIQ